MEIQIFGACDARTCKKKILNEIESNLLKLKLARGAEKSYKHEFRTKNSNYDRAGRFTKCNNSSFWF